MVLWLFVPIGQKNVSLALAAGFYYCEKTVMATGLRMNFNEEVLRVSHRSLVALLSIYLSSYFSFKGS